MNLYNIKTEYLKLINSVEEAEGEVTDELYNELSLTHEDYIEKGCSYAHVLNNKDMEKEIIEKEIERLKKRIQRIDKTSSRLKSRLIESMLELGIEKIENEIISISLRKSKSIEIINEAQIPQELMRSKTTNTPDKTAIKKAIESGEVVEGAVQVINHSLNIK